VRRVSVFRSLFSSSTPDPARALRQTLESNEPRAIERAMDSMKSLRWADVKRLVTDAYNRHGYAVNEPDLKPEEGVDLVLDSGPESIFVSCANWNVWQVGVAPLRRLHELMTKSGVRRGVVLTTGAFTEEARTVAGRLGLELVSGPRLAALLLA
jgi:restriction system protein